MDNADIAQRNRTVYQQAARAHRVDTHEEPQLIVDGEVLCIDCENPIELARLAAKPAACRCVFCQEQKEGQ